jgi:hypothetical protein
MDGALEIYPFDFPEVRLGPISWQAAREKAGGRGERYVTGYLGEIVVATTFNLPFRPLEDFANFDLLAGDGHTIDVKTYSSIYLSAWAPEEAMASYPGHKVRADLIALVRYSGSSGRVEKLIRPSHWGQGDFQSAAIEPDLSWAFAPLGRRPKPLLAFSHGPNELRHERNMLDFRVAEKKQQLVLGYLNWPQCIAKRAKERRREMELLAGEMSVDELKSITWLGYDLDPAFLQEVIAAKEQGHEFPRRPRAHAQTVREEYDRDGGSRITVACTCGWQHADLLTDRDDVNEVFAAHLPAASA